jgi:hypothetical protein
MNQFLQGIGSFWRLILTALGSVSLHEPVPSKELAVPHMM